MTIAHLVPKDGYDDPVPVAMVDLRWIWDEAANDWMGYQIEGDWDTPGDFVAAAEAVAPLALPSYASPKAVIHALRTNGVQRVTYERRSGEWFIRHSSALLSVWAAVDERGREVIPIHVRAARAPEARDKLQWRMADPQVVNAWVSQDRPVSRIATLDPWPIGVYFCPPDQWTGWDDDLDDKEAES